MISVLAARHDDDDDDDDGSYAIKLLYHGKEETHNEK